MAGKDRHILVTGGGTFVGDNIAAALLAEGAEVTLLVRPGAEDSVHLDLEPNFPRTVITDRIAPESVHRLITMIRFCGGLA